MKHFLPMQIVGALAIALLVQGAAAQTARKAGSPKRMKQSNPKPSPAGAILDRVQSLKQAVATLDRMEFDEHTTGRIVERLEEVVRTSRALSTEVDRLSRDRGRVSPADDTESADEHASPLDDQLAEVLPALERIEPKLRALPGGLKSTVDTDFPDCEVSDQCKASADCCRGYVGAARARCLHKLAVRSIRCVQEKKAHGVGSIGRM